MRKTMVLCAIAVSLIPAAVLADTNNRATAPNQTTTRTECPTCVHKYPKPPGTGGYESPGYGADGGGFRIKPQGGVQHVPPRQPVMPGPGMQQRLQQ